MLSVRTLPAAITGNTIEMVLVANGTSRKTDACVVHVSSTTQSGSKNVARLGDIIWVFGCL